MHRGQMDTKDRVPFFWNNTSSPSTVSGLILWVEAFKTNTRFFSGKSPIYTFLFEIALLLSSFNFVLHRFKVANTTV
jgi:hypothetical protein